MPPRRARLSDPTIRALFVRVLEAGEALRAAAYAYHEAVDRLPAEYLGGLRAEVDGVDDSEVTTLIDRLADRLLVPDDLPERRTVPTLQAAREALELADRIDVCELADLVERLTGVVDAEVTPALARVEREALAEFSRAR